ncbi:RNA polymerase factor sigma-54 [Hydrocarboniphaga effusa]|uniref:RNA polymerase factor sigma-54 n=1 Tax=Hydrocarboniphaga effusa TaxID=243629 RepID=UPI00398BFEAF
MKQSLSLRAGMALTMTPALQQAIRLLQLSSLDLQMEIQQALDSNVMLEMDTDASEWDAGEPAGEAASASESDGGEITEVTAGESIPEDMPVDADWQDVFDDYAPSGSGSSDDEGLQEYLQANLRGSATLQEHLISQAQLMSVDAVDAEIAAHLIDAINEDGYLEDWPGLCVRLEHEYSVTPERVEAVLRQIQDFDPPGIAARDLAECLRLQLQQLDPTTPGIAAALKITDGHLLLLARRDENGLRRATGLDINVIRTAAALIRNLQPHPGRPFQAHESDYLRPDVIVAKKSGRWRVSLNPEHMPRLRINSHYQSFIKRADQSRDQLTLKNHLQEARYFINSLESRNETILRVSQCIVEEQRAFLEYGEEAMRPLVLRDVAEQLGIHESTVSRATANKYMLTPRGLYELKYFFSSHVQTTQGGVCSATAIQAMIKRMVGGEDPARPLSDSTLADLLLKEGIQVARRTVAKYREALNIPPSHERKAVA